MDQLVLEVQEALQELTQQLETVAVEGAQDGLPLTGTTKAVVAKTQVVVEVVVQ